MSPTLYWIHIDNLININLKKCLSNRNILLKSLQTKIYIHFMQINGYFTI